VSDALVRPPARIAVIGLGNMGVPMAARLIGAGYGVTGYDVRPAARERFAREAKGEPSADLASAVREAAVIITMLPDGRIVRGVVEEMRSALPAHAIVIDMSSSDPVGTRTLGEALIAAGFRFIDAPVSGGVRRAVDGSLAIMVGGNAATIDAVEPVLSAIGKSVFRTGPLGSGHAMKALNNYVSGAGLVAAIEALRIGQAFGLDPNVMVDVLNASTGRNNSTEVKLKQFVISETFASGFSIGLMAKDIRTADELAAAMGVPAPLADSTAALWDEACQVLGRAADHTAVARYVKGDIG
jgi:3-hydroxyisobutyrate dehydrogenase